MDRFVSQMSIEGTDGAALEREVEMGKGWASYGTDGRQLAPGGRKMTVRPARRSRSSARF